MDKDATKALREALTSLTASGYTITKIPEAREPKPGEWWVCTRYGHPVCLLAYDLFTWMDGEWEVSANEVTPIRPIDMSLPETT